MAKNNNKKTKSKSKGGKKKSNKTNSGRMLRYHDPTAKIVCSISNPFCPEANGAKLPDANAVRSNTYQSRAIFALPTDAQGNLMLQITAGATGAYQIATLNAGGTSTAWGGSVASPFYSTYSASMAGYRVVSAGFRVVNTQSMNVSTGALVISECEDDQSLITGQTVTSLKLGIAADMTSWPRADVRVLMKPLGNQAEQYHTPTAYPNYTSYLVCLSGASVSLNVGYFELIVNYEWTATSISGLGVMSTPAAPSHPQSMAVRSQALENKSVFSTIKDAATYDTTWMNNVADTIRNMSNVGSAVASFFPMGRAALAGRSAMKMIGGRL
jgi:hypothetical protein